MVHPIILSACSQIPFEKPVSPAYITIQTDAENNQPASSSRDVRLLERGESSNDLAICSLSFF